MKNSTVFDCNLIELNQVNNRKGSITIVEGGMSLPFDIKRAYWLYDVPASQERGGHAHKELYQLMVAASGSFSITLSDGRLKKTIDLNNPNYGLLIVPRIWRELNNFSSGSICMVIASELYSEEDYIRCLEHFKAYKS